MPSLLIYVEPPGADPHAPVVCGGVGGTHGQPGAIPIVFDTHHGLLEFAILLQKG
jgi:hypothetical protein